MLQIIILGIAIGIILLGLICLQMGVTSAQPSKERRNGFWLGTIVLVIAVLAAGWLVHAAALQGESISNIGP